MIHYLNNLKSPLVKRKKENNKRSVLKRSGSSVSAGLTTPDYTLTGRSFYHRKSEVGHKTLTVDEVNRNAVSQYWSRIPWTLYAHFTTCPDLNEKVNNSFLPHPEFKKYLWNGEKVIKAPHPIIPPVVQVQEGALIRYIFRYIRVLNNILYGSKHSEIGKELSWIAGIEHLRSNLHAHLLVYGEGLERLSRMRAKIEWENVGIRTGMSRIYAYDWIAQKQRGVFYLAKHQVKSGNISQYIAKWHQPILQGANKNAVMIENRKRVIDKIPLMWRGEKYKAFYEANKDWITLYQDTLEYIENNDIFIPLSLHTDAQYTLRNLWNGVKVEDDTLSRYFRALNHHITQHQYQWTSTGAPDSAEGSGSQTLGS